jgi:hypothetical protein
VFAPRSSTLLVALAGACGGEPRVEPRVVEPWQAPSGTEAPDHVVIGPGAIIHASEGFAEVARLPPDAGMLGLRVLELGYWIVATPSTQSCTTSTSLFRDVDIRLAVDVKSLVPVAKAGFSTRFPDGTGVTVARGAPMRRVDALRFELVAEGVGVPLRFDLDPTTWFHAPDSVRFNRKPHDGYIWDWSGPLELEVGPTKLRASGRPNAPFVELVDRPQRRVELNGDCARITAKIGGDGQLPATRSMPIGGAPDPERTRLEAGTRLIWPTGEFAGHVRNPVEVRPSDADTEGLRCFEFEPFVLCVDPSSER